MLFTAVKHLPTCAQVANVAPLAKLASLAHLDVTDCARVTDRRAFIANKQITIVPA